MRVLYCTHFSRKGYKIMLRSLRKTELSNIEKVIYENEIKRLTKEHNEYMSKYETANKYKNEYEKLASDYRRKNIELDEQKRQTEELNQELEIMIEKLKKKFD